MNFAEWFDEEYPDGMGSATGGLFSQDDMQAAFEAGRDEEAKHLAAGGSFK